MCGREGGNSACVCVCGVRVCIHTHECIQLAGMAAESLHTPIAPD